MKIRFKTWFALCSICMCDANHVSHELAKIRAGFMPNALEGMVRPNLSGLKAKNALEGISTLAVSHDALGIHSVLSFNL